MIVVSNNKYPDDFPPWVKQCPNCGLGDAKKHIEITSDNIYAHFSLCHSCCMELARKLRA